MPRTTVAPCSQAAVDVVEPPERLVAQIAAVAELVLAAPEHAPLLRLQEGVVLAPQGEQRAAQPAHAVQRLVQLVLAEEPLVGAEAARPVA